MTVVQAEPEQEQATRCAIVVDESLPPGLAANAAAVLALTLGARHPALVGDEFADGDGVVHAGLIVLGLPVLRAPAAELTALRGRAAEAGIEVVDMPAHGQQTNDYDEFRRRVGATPAAELRYLGVAVCGAPRRVRSLTGSLALLR
jgi:hypothetical protein